MLEKARSILQVITVLFLSVMFIVCFIRILNKKGGWADAILMIMSIPSWLFAVCV